MKQMSLGAAGFERETKRTRKREFLDEMNLVVPWSELVVLVTPHAPTRGAKGGRPPFHVETMLRIHFLQQWFILLNPAMDEKLHDTPMFRELWGSTWARITCLMRALSCDFATCWKLTS